MGLPCVRGGGYPGARWCGYPYVGQRRVADNPHMGKTVLIVDDHAGFRKSARRLLEAEGFDVVGEAADGRSGIASARNLKPDLVLLDIQLPDLDGFSVAAGIASSDDSPPAIVLTSTRSAAEFGGLIVESGALGFVPKSELSGRALRDLIA